MAGKSDFVKEELMGFLKTKSPDIDESGIDEIVLSYMVSILEELGTELTSEDVFDVEAFTDMMEAYMPGFAQISSVEVSEWMFGLSTKLSNQDKPTESSELSETRQSLENFSLRLDAQTLPGTECPQVCRKRTSSSTSSTLSEGGQRSRKSSSRQSSTSESELTAVETADEEPECNLEEDELVKALLEMFPGTCTLEVAHCLCITNGHVESAAQLLLHRMEIGESITQDSGSEKAGKRKTTTSVNNKTMKDQILTRYGYVDTAGDKKDHRPLGPKHHPKKMVRYLDGKVVSTKGERFTEVKKDEDETMKKTYVNLKPARQYRFH